MILPTRVVLFALLAWMLFAVVASFVPSLFYVWIIGLAVFGLWLVIDLCFVIRQIPPVVTRRCLKSLSLGSWAPVTLVFRSTSSHAVRLILFDHYPQECEQAGMPVEVNIPRKKDVSVTYRIRPQKRGDLSFGQLEIRMFSPARAWYRQGKIGESQSIKVYPDFSTMAKDALRATEQNVPGMLKRHRRGQGMDFDQLRAYREGDALRQIDWKATVRMGKIISREYQDERDQRILLLVDCGRRMAAQDRELSHFDYSLNAVLLLAYVGLKHGDSVGLMTLGGPERFLPAQRTASTVSRVLNTVYDLQPTLQTSDYETAAQQLLKRERKRSLVVLFTNLRDEDDQSLLAATHLLGERHLVLIASLREKVLDQARSLTVHSTEDAALRAAATLYRHQRDAVLSRLRANGVLCLDVEPETLAVDIVNRYLAIKAAGRL